MSAKLAVGVMIRHPDSGAPVFLRAGSVPPDWAKDRLGTHVFADGQPPAPASPERPAPVEPVRPEVPAPPPRYGKGSSAEAWRAWATAAGVDLSAYGSGDATRDQVVAAAIRDGVLAP